MQNLHSVDVVQSKAKLHEPVHNFGLGEKLLLFLLLLNVECQIAVVAKLHDNNEDPLLDERVLVRHDVRVVKLLE